jgi:hypothetical protein
MIFQVIMTFEHNGTVAILLIVFVRCDGHYIRISAIRHDLS